MSSIFLIGMMGSGKTTLGKQLAKCMNYTFVDLDTYIERREGKTIAALFEEGQDQFRMRERQALEAVAVEYDRAVISTGGGAPCFFDNIDFINKCGTSVFLDLPVEEIVKRLSNSNLTLRPLVAGKTKEELNDFINKTLQARRQFYEKAQYTLLGKDQTTEALLSLLNLA